MTELAGNAVGSFHEELTAELDRLARAGSQALYRERDPLSRTYFLALLAVTKKAQALCAEMRSGRDGAFQRVPQRTNLFLPPKRSSLTFEEISQHVKFLAIHREQLTARLRAGLNPNEDPLCSASLHEAAHSLLSMLLEARLKSDQTTKIARSRRTRLRSHLDIMRDSLRGVHGDSPESALAAAFHAALSRKQAATGRTPRLILVHDVDNNLVMDEQYYKHFPNWPLFIRARELHDTYKISPWQARFPVLSFFGSAHPQSRESHFTLLQQVGQHAYASMFADARELIQSAFPPSALSGDIQSVLVTAGNLTAATVLAGLLSLQEKFVYAVDERSSMGFDKPAVILKYACQSPENIVICSDDADASLIRALSSPSVLNDAEIAAPLSLLCFFAARTPGPQETDCFSLHKALEANDVPYLRNTRLTTANGAIHGYQGVLRYVAWYRQWLAQERRVLAASCLPSGSNFSKETEICGQRLAR